MITRVALRDYEATKANLNPGTKVESDDHYELWRGRDILTESRSGIKQLKTNCWVVRSIESGWETYYHGDKTQDRCEQDARRDYQGRNRHPR